VDDVSRLSPVVQLARGVLCEPKSIELKILFFGLRSSFDRLKGPLPACTFTPSTRLPYDLVAIRATARKSRSIHGFDPRHCQDTLRMNGQDTQQPYLSSVVGLLALV
jgi:hypothetical protein